MPSEEAVALATVRHGLVIAPAGCGKTFLLAEAVGTSAGRQLVLTHTHAGVRAIRGHLERQSIPSAKYRVTTVDSFALRYATAFPTLSGWTAQIPTSADWKTLRVASHQVIQRSAIRRVMGATYDGVFVDEYQDCTAGQHALLLALAEFMPVRVVGDPLQAIFALLDETDACPWSEVEKSFPLIGELTTPHRWLSTNQSLGEWLLDTRKRLIAGQEVDLRQAPLAWESTIQHTDQSRISACRGVKPKRGETIIALRKWRTQCHRLARSLNGQYRAMETVECEDLLEWAEKLDAASGLRRAQLMLDFADTCMAGLPAAVKQLAGRLASGKQVMPRRVDYQRVLNAVEAVRDSDELVHLLDLMAALAELNHRLVKARDELWREMKRAIREHRTNPSASLRQTAWNQRSRLRHIGGRVDRTALGTPLLVKGLEFDHAVVLDAADHSEAESLYVALTRASRSLTVLSSESVLRRNKPRFVLHNGKENSELEQP